MAVEPKRRRNQRQGELSPHELASKLEYSSADELYSLVKGILTASENGKMQVREMQNQIPDLEKYDEDHIARVVTSLTNFHHDYNGIVTYLDGNGNPGFFLEEY